MSQLFYTLKISTPFQEGALPGVWEQRLQYPSKQAFPSPLGTCLTPLALDDILFFNSEGEVYDHDLPSLLEVVGYEDHYIDGSFYMWLWPEQDESGDYTSLGIETVHAKALVEQLKKEGWEDCPFA
jgi:hypothetical protein